MLNEYLKSYGFKETEISDFLEKVSKVYSISSLLSKMKEMNAYLKKMGYQKTDIKRMALNFPPMYSYSISHLEEQKEFFLDFGFIDYFRICKIYPNILGKSEESLEEKIDTFLLYGFSKKEVIFIFTTAPSILGKSKSRLEEYFYQIQLLGFTRREIINLISKYPQLLTVSIDSIENRFSHLESLGFSTGAIVDMVKRFPPIVCLDPETLEKKIKLIEEFYGRENTLKLFLGLPNLFGLSEKNLLQKMKYIHLIQVQNYLLEHPKSLMQSNALTYARYEFLKEQGKNIHEGNARCIYEGSKRFQDTYHITSEELLEQYPCEEMKKVKSR